MTETHPPRFGEALLESFGADVEFRDAIIGDLAQEHAQRVERYGERPARLWYYREALFAMPHLLRSALKNASFADARRMLNVAGLAYLSTMAIEIALSLAVLAVFGPLPWMKTVYASPVGRWVAMLAVGSFGPVCAGYLAATFEEKRPMLAALSLGVIWTVLAIVASVVIVLLLDPHPAGWFVPTTMVRLLFIPFIVAASLIGGTLRVRRASRA